MADRIASWMLRGPLAVVVVGLCAFQLATWIPHFLTWPFFVDHDVFSTLAFGWDSGLHPYRDLRGDNFPGTIYQFWAVGKLFGWGRTAPVLRDGCGLRGRVRRRHAALEPPTVRAVPARGDRLRVIPELLPGPGLSQRDPEGLAWPAVHDAGADDRRRLADPRRAVRRGVVRGVGLRHPPPGRPAGPGPGLPHRPGRRPPGNELVAPRGDRDHGRLVGDGRGAGRPGLPAGLARRHLVRLRRLRPGRRLRRAV